MSSAICANLYNVRMMLQNSERITTFAATAPTKEFGDMYKYKSFCFITNIFTHGYLEQKETIRCHGEDTKSGHEARMDCTSLSFFAWLPLSQERERATGHAGHRVAQIWHRHIHTWMFLARTRGGRYYTQDQPRILEEKD